MKPELRKITFEHDNFTWDGWLLDFILITGRVYAICEKGNGSVVTVLIEKITMKRDR